jgi:predicted O-methyltransferase YrrM
MSMQALQAFVARQLVSTGALTALAAALDAKANNAPLDPELDARVQEMLEAVGVASLVKDVGPQEAGAILPMLRAMYLFDAKLMFAKSRGKVWNYADDELLQAIGEAARGHAHAFQRQVLPACDGLAERFAKPGATLIDIGVGVAGTAIAIAQMWPELRVVGIDVWQPSLRLARDNVDRAALADRIELREQGTETLEDKAAFDCAWFALAFIPERVVRVGLERTLASLRPGGWIISGVHNVASKNGVPADTAALGKLRGTLFGGPMWNEEELESTLRATGYTDVRSLPPGPGSPIVFVIGRRPT